jgi:hypothetical protein
MHGKNDARVRGKKVSYFFISSGQNYNGLKGESLSNLAH